MVMFVTGLLIGACAGILARCVIYLSDLRQPGERGPTKLEREAASIWTDRMDTIEWVNFKDGYIAGAQRAGQRLKGSKA